MINIIKRATISFYKEKFPKAATALQVWYLEFSRQSFKTSQELKIKYGDASVIGDKRIVFNIMGNKYRLIVKMNYSTNSCYVIWFGTHESYDSIKAEAVQYSENTKI